MSKMAIGTRFEAWNKDSMGKWSSLKCVITIAVRAKPFNNMLPNWDALWFTEALHCEQKESKCFQSKRQSLSQLELLSGCKQTYVQKLMQF